MGKKNRVSVLLAVVMALVLVPVWCPGPMVMSGVPGNGANPIAHSDISGQGAACHDASQKPCSVHFDKVDVLAAPPTKASDTLFLTLDAVFLRTVSHVLALDHPVHHPLVAPVRQSPYLPQTLVSLFILLLN